MVIPRNLLAILICAVALPAFPRNVIYVDNARAGGPGSGTADKPFATLAEAQAAGRDGDVIYLAEGTAPYEGGIALRHGQLLIGAAFGLDAAAVEFHLTLPPMPAVQGPGPTIHGGVWLGGDNVVAGCTIAVDNGAAITSTAADAAVILRRLYLHPARLAAGIALQNPGAVSIAGGSMDGATSGTALWISGGTADVSIEHFPIAGSFGTVVSIAGRQRGKVTFHDGSPLKIAGATADAIVVGACSAPVVFDDPIRIVTHGGRGIFARQANLTFSGGDSSIESNDAAAVDIADSPIEATFASISASAAVGGKLLTGLLLDKVRGKFVVTGHEEQPSSGGTIRNARAYGIRITQSTGIRLAHMVVADSGSADTVCSDAVERETNVRCRAAIYLRHVADSSFDDVAVTGGAGVGLNANNVTRLAFSNLQISGAGATLQEPALLLQEAVDSVRFTLCRIFAGEGGGVVLDQRFNQGMVSFDRCEFGAAGHGVPLLAAHTAGNATLDLQINDGRILDSPVTAILIEAGGTGRTSLQLTDSWIQHLGGHAVMFTASNAARTRLALHGDHIVSGSAPTILVMAGKAESDTAAICIDLAENTIPADGAIAIASGAPAARIEIVGDAAPAAIAARNGGADVQINGRGSVTSVSACPR